MTISRNDLEGAAFWDKLVCLDCSSVIDPGDEGFEPYECPQCGSADLHTARFLLRCADFLEGEDASV